MHKTAVALLIALMILPAGCDRGQAPARQGPENQVPRQPEQVLRFNAGSYPATLDPALTGDESSASIVYQLFEGLTRRGPGGLESGVATQWDVSEDGLTWRFHLRPAKWSDGTPLAADDFVFAWKRVLDPALKAPYARLFYFIAGAEEYNRAPARTRAATLNKLRDAVGVTAVDAKTLEVRLREPVPSFPALTSFLTFFPVPPKGVEADPAGWWQDTEAFISNGPFVMSKMGGDQGMVLTPNYHYWDAEKVPLRRIDVQTVPDPAESLSIFEAGELDVVRPRLMPLRDAPRLLDLGLARRAPLLATYYLAFNTRRGPFQDPMVRLAFTLAVSRTALISRVLEGLPVPATAFVPPGIINPATAEDFRGEGGGFFRDGDFDAARDLLAGAGYPDGAGFPAVTLLVNSEGENAAVMEFLSQAWRDALGVDVRVSALPWKEFVTAREAGDFDLVRAGWIGAYPDPLAFLSLLRADDPGNLARWRNSAYDEILDQARREPEAGRRMELLHRAEIVLMDAMPVLPLYFYVQVWLQQDNIEGTFVDIQGDIFLRSTRVVARPNGGQ